MQHLSFLRLARPVALALLVGLVFVLGLGGTAWAGTSEAPARQGGSPGSTVPPRQADVSIQKNGTWTGNRIVFTLLVKNAGPVVASAVSVTDQIPAGLAVQSIATNKGQCSLIRRAVTCSLGSLAVNATATITIRTTVPAGLNTVTNRAVVGTSTRDPNPDNNIATRTVTRP